MVTLQNLTKNARDVVLLQPLRQGLDGIPVTELLRHVRHHQGSCVNLVGFEPSLQAKLVHLIIGDSVIANQRVGEHQDLAVIGRIRQGLGVTNHSRLKYCKYKLSSTWKNGLSIFLNFSEAAKNALPCE